MSRWVDLLRRQRRDDGFTVVEIMVALTLLAIVTAAAIPLFIVGAKAANAAKFHTEAKNLAQKRLEAMRDMQFHVDRQNGPFVDMLDIYYTNLNTAPVTRTRGTCPGSACETMVDQWIASGGVAPEPTNGPFFRVKVTQVPGFPQFSQTIDTQYITSTGSVVPASAFSTYDSQTEGKDSPPSLMVGITVITSWSDHGATHKYTTYTRIDDSRGTTSLLSSQARGEFLRITSTGSSGNALAVDLAVAEADGSVTTGSLAAANAQALTATDSAGNDFSGTTGVATSPNGGTSTTPQTSPIGSGCTSWVGAGMTAVGNVSASTVNGLALVPATVDTATPPVNQLTASLTGSQTGFCGSFNFSNQTTSYLPNLNLDNEDAIVRIPNNGGNNSIAVGSAWINATSPSTSPHSVTSGANASTPTGIPVRLFHGAGSFDGLGLVNVYLNSSSIACNATYTSGSGVSWTSTGSWSITVNWQQYNPSTSSYSRPSQTWTWNAGDTSADPLAAIDPHTIQVSPTHYLSDYIASWSTARKIVENSTSGIHQLTGIVSIATQPLRAASDGTPDLTSAVSLQIGNLSCVADDSR